MAIVTDEGGFIPERYEHELDNRDPNTTWIRLEGCHGDYIEVSPYEIIENMVENCKEWIIQEEGITEEALRTALDTLKRASGWEK